MSRRSSAHGMLIISGVKADGSEAGIPGKKEKGRCDCVKFSGIKMVTGISIQQYKWKSEMCSSHWYVLKLSMIAFAEMCYVPAPLQEHHLTGNPLLFFPVCCRTCVKH